MVLKLGDIIVLMKKKKLENLKRACCAADTSTNRARQPEAGKHASFSNYYKYNDDTFVQGNVWGRPNCCSVPKMCSAEENLYLKGKSINSNY